MKIYDHKTKEIVEKHIEIYENPTTYKKINGSTFKYLKIDENL